jgi:2-polyprenyl-6-hydroxyphenyl methylase/3-demethylubiquinone-9 3-methyltransferase
VVATDIDADSVNATSATLGRFWQQSNWLAKRISVFDLDPSMEDPFDIVYSWGVLHHTGAMYEAIERAASMVAPRGLFCVALYRRTPMCEVWKLEKRFYSRSPAAFQRLVRRTYIAAFRIGLRLRGRSPSQYVAEYCRTRGMDFEHDVHDWLGGYPYESASPPDLHRFMDQLGFRLVRQFVSRAGSGLFGSGNDEYVFQRS